MMNVNQKGDIGLAKVLADLTAKLFPCFVPLSGSCCVDLVVANPQMELRRLQVKYRNAENGLVVVSFNTVINGVKVPICFERIDGWAIYCPETDSVYYVSRSDVDVTKSRFSLRVVATKQFQPKASPSGELYRDAARLWRDTQEAEEAGLLNL